MRFLQAAHTSGAGNLPITRLVIHCTVSACVPGQAWRTACMFSSPAAGGSAHKIIDPGEVVRAVLDNYVAWHAPPNPHSLGYELCDPVGSSQSNELPASRWQDGPHQAMLRLAAAEVRADADRYGVPLRRLSVAQVRAGEKGICGHYDVSRAFGQSSHWNPGAGFPWDQFMGYVIGGGGGTVTVTGKDQDMIAVGQQERGIWLIGPKGAYHLDGEQWAQVNSWWVAKGLVPYVEVSPGGAGPAAFDRLIQSVEHNPERALIAPGEVFYPADDIAALRVMGLVIEGDDWEQTKARLLESGPQAAFDMHAAAGEGSLKDAVLEE